MSLRKRGGIWWIDVRAPDGERIRRTTGTANKALAQEAHDRFKSELWRIANLGDKPRHTWNDAVVRWLKEQSHKATANEDVSKLRWLRSLPGWQGPDAHQSRHARSDHRRQARARASQCNGEPHAGTGARNSPQVRQRLGMAGPGTEGADVEGAHPPHSLPDAGGSATALAGVAGAPGRHGGVLARDGIAGGERHRTAVVAGGFDAASWRGCIPIRPRPGGRSRCRSMRTRWCWCRSRSGST